MATYNRDAFILETLNSIKNQTYINYECLIIDDGGTDNTFKVIEPILKDKKFKFFNRPKSYKKGLCGSRNFGLDIAKGDFIIFFDDDDIVHPKLLETLLSIFKDNNMVDFIHFKKKSFENNFNYSILEKRLNISYKYLKDTLFEEVILGKLPLASCTVLWRKKVFEKKRFNEDLHYAEEWELYSRFFIEKNIKGIVFNDILYFNRKHINSNTGEFWSNNPKRINSMKLATQKILEFVILKNKLTYTLFKYFIGQAHLHNIPNIIKIIFKERRSVKMVFYNFLFPLRYRIYKFLKNFKK